LNYASYKSDVEVLPYKKSKEPCKDKGKIRGMPS
jgi:hypothetical protein